VTVPPDTTNPFTQVGIAFTITVFVASEPNTVLPVILALSKERTFLILLCPKSHSPDEKITSPTIMGLDAGDAIKEIN
jgi:hypothetical protein